MVLFAISAVSSGEGTFGTLQGILAAVILLYVAGVVFPPTRDRFTDGRADELGKWSLVTIVILGVVLAVFVGPSPSAEPSSVEEPDSPQEAIDAQPTGGTQADAESAQSNSDTPTPTPTPINTPTAEPTPTPTPSPAFEPGEIEQVVSETLDEQGLGAGVSEKGELVVFGLDTGTLVVFNENGHRRNHPLAIDQGLTHIIVSEQPNHAVVASIDDHTFGGFDLSGSLDWGFRFQGLWDIDATPDYTKVAAVSAPFEGTGAVGVVEDGEVKWETEFERSTGLSVDISDDAEYVAVGAEGYYSGANRFGSNGIILFSGDGERLWFYETNEAVLSVNIDVERELIIAGTDDGKIIALDLDGEKVWEKDEYGGWVFLSDDGSTLISSELELLLAFDPETGDELWRVEVPGYPGDSPGYPGDSISVSDDGTRVLAVSRFTGDAVLVDEGEVIWSKSNPEGPAMGAISSDGMTWGVILQDNDDGTATVEVYRQH